MEGGVLISDELPLFAATPGEVRAQSCELSQPLVSEPVDIGPRSQLDFIGRVCNPTLLSHSLAARIQVQ